ncbi:MAG: hypothetical protein WB565_00180 [Acidimicrobiales bacterium]
MTDTVVHESEALAGLDVEGFGVVGQEGGPMVSVTTEPAATFVPGAGASRATTPITPFMPSVDGADPDSAPPFAASREAPFSVACAFSKVSPTTFGTSTIVPAVEAGGLRGAVSRVGGVVVVGADDELPQAATATGPRANSPHAHSGALSLMPYLLAGTVDELTPVADRLAAVDRVTDTVLRRSGSLALAWSSQAGGMTAPTPL